jgi:regulator of cell morphogenesis and NO signaling
MTISPETTVGALASQFPRAIPVFHRFRIEVCCDGARPLGDVCRERRVGFDDLAAALTGAIGAPSPRPYDWSTRPLSELTTHLIEGFHEPLRQDVPRLRQMAVRLQAHRDSSRHALSVVLYELEKFQADLEPHMSCEEEQLFPLINRIEAGRARLEDPARFLQLRAALEADHTAAAHALLVLRRVTDRYDVPPRACATQRDLYHLLNELEQLTQLHIHLENNILFPRAAALLSEAEGSS